MTAPDVKPGRTVDLAGHRIMVDDDQPTFWDRVEKGTWEPETIAVLARCLGPQTTFVDLGAWVGPTTLLAAATGARCIAVEADPAALDQLRRNLAANPSLAARVAVLDRAIHATEGLVRLGARRKPGDSMSSVLLAEAARTWEAQTITPTALAECVGDARHVFVKIDIEGAEFGLAPALAPLLAAERTQVLLSLHPKLLRARMNRDAGVAQVAAVLSVFAGWDAMAVGGSGSATAPPDAGDIYDGLQSDCWLFSAGA